MGKIFNLKSKMKNNKGAVIVEAAFILPMVIAIIIFLIYIALLQIEQSMVYSYTQILGQEICNSMCFPGYELLQNKERDEYSEENFVSLDNVYSIHDPYRYIFKDNINLYDYEQLLASEASKYSIFEGSIKQPKITIKHELINTSVIVEAEYIIELPSIVRIVGIDRCLSTKISSVTYANDSSEFIRNIDLTCDVVSYLMKKYNLNIKTNDFYHKILNLRKKLL